MEERINYHPEPAPYRMEGELAKKEVTHFQSILTIVENDGDEITLVIPHDLDDFVKVGARLKIQIQQVFE